MPTSFARPLMAPPVCAPTTATSPRATWPGGPTTATEWRPPLAANPAGADEVTVSTEENKRVVANLVEVCQNQHDLAAADDIFHPEFVNHYMPEARPIPATARPAGRW